MGATINPYIHYGRPLLGSLLAFATIAALILGLGGEQLRSGYWQYVAINTIYLTIIGFLVWLVFDVRSSRFKLPSVKKRIEDQLILVCGREDWLGYGAAVAIYARDGDYESPLATGLVSNIQANGLVQIQIIEGFNDEDESSLKSRIQGVQLIDFIIKPGQDWRRTS